MIYQLTTTEGVYNDKEKVKLEQLGFTFTPVTDSISLEFWPDAKWQIGEPITVVINSLDELNLFCEKWGPLVITHTPPAIEIYNTYRE